MNRLGYKLYIRTAGGLRPVTRGHPIGHPGQWYQAPDFGGPLTVVRSAQGVAYWYSLLVDAFHEGDLPDTMPEYPPLEWWLVEWKPWDCPLPRGIGGVVHLWSGSCTQYCLPVPDFVKGRVGLARWIKPIRPVPLWEIKQQCSS